MRILGCTFSSKLQFSTYVVSFFSPSVYCYLFAFSSRNEHSRKEVPSPRSSDSGPRER